MNEEQRRASDAKALLGNPVFKGAMEAMKTKLDHNVSSVDPDNKDQCARVVLAVQILAGIEREIQRFIADGEVADLLELENVKKLNLKERVSGRMVR